MLEARDFALAVGLEFDDVGLKEEVEVSTDAGDVAIELVGEGANRLDVSLTDTGAMSSWRLSGRNFLAVTRSVPSTSSNPLVTRASLADAVSTASAIALERDEVELAQILADRLVN